ncbi:unnamed protein product [Linum trigynum]|uniref:MICOS complex subunit MIC60 n=1 Tax=Linum trigynum TaxID=586398 RepID=A0AAV2E2V5_9ROSI
MFRRSILALSSRRSIHPRQITPPRVPSLRKGFSTKPHQNAPPNTGAAGQPPKPKSTLPRVILGTTAVAGAAFLAYQSGYLDQYIGEKEQAGHVEVKGTHIRKEVVPIVAEEPVKTAGDVAAFAQKVKPEDDVARVEDGEKIETLTSGIEDDKKVENLTDLPQPESGKKIEDPVDLAHDKSEQKDETQTGIPHHEDVSSTISEIPSQAAEAAIPIAEDDTAVAPKEKHEPQFSASINHETVPSINPEPTISGERNDEVKVSVIPKEDDVKTVISDHPSVVQNSEAELNKGADASNLLDTYHLKEKTVEMLSSEAPVEEGTAGELSEGYVTKDGKLVMDFLQAIHAAEKRQAELDAQVFTQEKRVLKEKYEKQLRDSRARELMRAEEAAILDKEIKRERAKAAAAVRSVEEKMEEKLKMELQQKEAEAEAEVKRIQELAKAELAAAIASEKATQIEKVVEANLNIDALCMAFFARSEEARQIHSVHKLALGALALEDALSQGLPIQKELEDLSAYLEGTDKDSLVQLVLSTLPEETRQSGTDTVLQLNQKFNALKGTLRHHILIPPGGGGILAHAMAQIASWLRLKEVDPSGDGIESVISRVQTLLSEGKLAEAADVLQDGVRGSQAEQMAGDWVRRAKNRAITEQALTVLQSYATCISLTRS